MRKSYIDLPKRLRVVVVLAVFLGMAWKMFGPTNLLHFFLVVGVALLIALACRRRSRRKPRTVFLERQLVTDLRLARRRVQQLSPGNALRWLMDPTLMYQVVEYQIQRRLTDNERLLLLKDLRYAAQRRPPRRVRLTQD